MRNKHISSSLSVSFIIFSLVTIMNGCKTPTPYYHPPITDHIVIDSPMLKTLWVRENVFIRDDNLNPMMVAAQGVVIFLGGLDIDDSSAVSALKANDGDLLWQEVFGNPTAIYASPDGLYVGESGRARIVKYEPYSGRIIWTKQLPGRGLVHIVEEMNQLSVQTSSTRDKFFVLNAISGDVIRQLENTGIFLSTEKVTFQRSILTNELEAVGTSSQNLRWSVTVDHEFLMIPIFTEHEILVRTDVGKIYCIDRDTGSVKWNTDNIAISNLTIANNWVYFLSRDGKLQGIDLQSGEVIQLIQFDTERFALNGEVHIGGYHVAYDPQTGIVFAELGDSAQLFAFQVIEKLYK